jgi:metal-sulfur cluster biosynthetic enzyme
MKLIRELKENEPGVVRIVFRSTSPFCPIALKLAADIKNAASRITGVNRVLVYCEGHIMEEKINRTINE